MDPIQNIKIHKDTTFALLLEAQKRKWEIFYLEHHQLFLSENKVYGLTARINVQDKLPDFFSFIDHAPQKMPLSSFDMVLMRKDPPFDIPYLYATYLLELAQKEGAFIVNDPRSIRDANEKLFTAFFPQCCPETLVTSRKTILEDFFQTHQKIILKPLHTMGGHAVFLLDQHNPNFHVTVEVLTKNGKYPIMAQRYLPEIKDGDKRILLIDGEPYPYALARIPSPGDIRGNLAAGARGKGIPLNARDRWIAEQVGPTLRDKGLFFVGLDVIGDYLTEINVTSPTCVREIEAAFGVNIAAHLLNKLIEKKYPKN